MRFRDRFNLLKECWALIQWQRRTIEALQRQKLDLTRSNYNLCSGLLTEIEDPGSIDRDLVFAALRDWADEVARQEELVV